MNSKKVKALIDRFFAEGASDPEAYLAAFKSDIRPLSSEEMWAVMDGILARLEAEVVPLAMAA